MREVVIPSFLSLSIPISEVLEKIAKASVRLVELHGDAPGSHIDLTDESAVDSLAKVIERLPLEVHSVHCAFSQPNEQAWDISQTDTRLRLIALSNRMKVIKSAARLGARHVVIHMGGRDRGRERLAFSRESLAKLAETARDHKTRIAIENLPPDHLGGSLDEIKEVIEGLDPEAAGFCLDTGHALLGQDRPCDYIRSLGDRLIAIHWHANNGVDDAHLFPGSNECVWDEFFAALNEVSYYLPVTIEAVPPNGTSLEDAVKEAQAALNGKSLRLSPKSVETNQSGGDTDPPSLIQG